MGMDSERLSEITKGLADKAPEDAKIYGLYNVNERIRLFYGEEYGISIESEYDKGTTVTIRLPKNPNFQ